jgi:hypothetical protein
MATGMSHEKALKYVHPRGKTRKNPKTKRAPYYGTHLRQKLSAILRYGYDVGLHRHRPRSFTKFKNPTIITIKWKTAEHCHAIIWDPKTKKIYDPGYKKALSYELYRKNFRYALELIELD